MENFFNIRFEHFSEFTYNIIRILVEKGKNIWKLMKYATADALEKEDLTEEEKLELIYQGQPDSEPYRVFRIPFTDDAFTAQVCKIHIFPWVADPYRRTNGNQTFMFQIVCHNKIGTLKDGRARCDVFMEELGKIINGADIAGIGMLTFDSSGGRPDYLRQKTWNNQSYFGYEFALTTGIV